MPTAASLGTGDDEPLPGQLADDDAATAVVNEVDIYRGVAAEQLVAAADEGEGTAGASIHDVESSGAGEPLPVQQPADDVGSAAASEAAIWYRVGAQQPIVAADDGQATAAVDVDGAEPSGGDPSRIAAGSESESDAAEVGAEEGSPAAAEDHSVGDSENAPHD